MLIGIVISFRVGRFTNFGKPESCDSQFRIGGANHNGPVHTLHQKQNIIYGFFDFKRLCVGITAFAMKAPQQLANVASYLIGAEFCVCCGH
jgi:hypothetical protein